MQGFGGSCFVSVKTHHSPEISKNLRQGLISWNSPVSLRVCLSLGGGGGKSMLSVLSENVFVVSSK